jgi:hypothetical protein
MYRTTYEGLILSIFSPSELFTHSLLMNNPIGCVYFRPFGAVSSTVRSDIALFDTRQKDRVEGLMKLTEVMDGLIITAVLLKKRCIK